MGGGGSSDDYSAKQAQIESQKKAARASLNALFGIAPEPGQTPAQSSGVSGSMRGLFDDVVGRSQGGAPAADPLATEAAANKTARDALYQQIRDNAFTAGKRGLDDRRDTAARQNKFALFAQGLNGGSEDIDQNALLQRTYNEGLINLGAKADAAKADIQSSDEQTRLGLLQSIDAGMDQGSALSSALGQMRVNADRASAQSQGQTVGDLFGDAGLLYTQSQAGRATKNAAWDYITRYGSTSPRPASSSRGSGGIITSTG